MIPMPGNKTKNLDVSVEDQRRYAITDDQVKTLATWGNDDREALW